MSEDAGAGAQGPAAGEDDTSAEQELHELVNGSEDEGGETSPEDELAKARAEAKKWKDLSRKNEARARDGAKAAAKLKEIEEAGLSAQQKAEARAAEADERARQAELRAWRSDAVSQYELHPDLAPFLGGETEEDVQASAETLARVVNERVDAALKAAQNGGQQPRQGNGLRRPVENLRPGAAPAGQNNDGSPDAWLRSQLSGGRR